MGDFGVTAKGHGKTTIKLGCQGIKECAEVFSIVPISRGRAVVRSGRRGDGARS